MRAAGTGGGFVGELRRIGGGFVVEPARPTGGGFVVEPARGGSAPDAIELAGRTDANGGGFVVEPARPTGGGFVVEPARPGGANPCDVVDGLGAAANPAAVLVVEVGTVGDERSCAGIDVDERSCAGIDPVVVDDGRCAGITPDRFCAGIAPEFVDEGRCAGIAPELVDVGRVIGALAEGGYGEGAALDGAIGARTVVDVASASGPPTLVASALRASGLRVAFPREPPRAVGISSGTRTFVAVASPIGPL